MLNTAAVVAAATARWGWPIRQVKARRSELVKRAQKQPQQLTSHAGPLVEAEELDLERCPDLPRDVDLRAAPP